MFELTYGKPATDASIVTIPNPSTKLGRENMWDFLISSINCLRGRFEKNVIFEDNLSAVAKFLRDLNWGPSPTIISI